MKAALAHSRDLEAERAELEAVLRSGIFSRAPNLANFLKYVCERYFEGASDVIKEYSIATEALGRTADFDQKKDAIVRVEAHRLRRRLFEYYSKGDGTHHSIQIQIPPGQYAPRFVERTTTQIEQPSELKSPVPDTATIIPFIPEEATPAAVELAEHVGRSSRWRLWVAALTILGLLSIAAMALYQHRGKSEPENWVGNWNDPVPSEFRFIAGYRGKPIPDRYGHSWDSDRYYKGGTSSDLISAEAVQGAPDPKIIRSQRVGSFQYDIPVRPGVYEIHLYFIETAETAEALYSRLFRMYLNGSATLTEFSPGAAAGAPNRLLIKIFRDVAPAIDGKIHLRFEAQTGQPFLTAGEILASNPGQVRPVRIVMAPNSVTDPNGTVWAADEFAAGGILVERKDSIQDPALKMLFNSERFGNFSYRIPVAPGQYRLRLFFAETYFGSKLPYANEESAIGARVFHLYCSGQNLLRNFDVVKEAGGPNKAVIKTFDNIEPDAQGQIVLEFIPVRNWPEINAIEVTQMP